MVAQVVVVIGVGGMGQIVARSQGPGKKLLLADFNAQGLEKTAEALAHPGSCGSNPQGGSPWCCLRS